MAGKKAQKWWQQVSAYLPELLIFAAAAGLRLDAARLLSLSNDELSSMYRSFGHSSWHDVYVKGILTDGHPPFTYVFLRCWMMLAGDSVFAVRLPFVLASVLGLYFSYRLAVLWFGRGTALAVTALLAATSYNIYYGQIARPYAFGLLFTQMVAYYWSRYFGEGASKGGLRVLAAWAFASVLACYTHYFSFMAAVLIGLSGLFLLGRGTLLPYLSAAGLIVLSLLPGLPVFRQQLSYDGLDWLPRPGHDWLWRYLAETLNNSVLLAVAVGGLLFVALVLNARQKVIAFNRYHLFGLSWFGISFVVGYLKSVYSKPVLQYSCLYFSYPFLLMAVLSPLAALRLSCIRWSALLLLCLAIYDSIWRGGYYRSEHHGEFKGIAAQMAGMADRCGGRLQIAVNVNNPYYWDYYWVKQLHRPEKVSLYGIESEEEVHSLDSLVQQAQEAYFAVAWSNKGTPDTIFKVIERKYPLLLSAPAHFNSGIRLYGRPPAPELQPK